MADCKASNIPADHGMKVSHEMFQTTDDEINFMSKVPYAELYGAINYLSYCTRPDIVLQLENFTLYVSTRLSTFLTTHDAAQIPQGNI